MPEATLLVVGGGIEAVPGIRLAKELGLCVVVSDGDAAAPGFKIADHALVASTYDVAETVRVAHRFHVSVRPIDGVLCMATDVPLTVAAVAERLGLPGLPLDVAARSMDKLAMKRRFSEDGLPVPQFTPVTSVAHLRELVTRMDYPLVLKPVDSRGGRGVLRLTPEVNLEWACEFARRFSPTQRLMLERFLDGPQVSTESVVLNGTAYTPGFSDRNYEYLERFAPHIIENGGTLPTSLPPATQQAVRNLVQAAANSLGVQNGIVKGDIVVHQGHPHVIEVAARLSGGYFCTHQIPLSTGVDIVRPAIWLALGRPVDPTTLQPQTSRGVAQRFCFPAPGRVVAISGLRRVKRQPQIALCDIRVTKGDVVRAVDCHPARVGTVIATAEHRQEAIEIAERAIRDISILTEPETRPCPVHTYAPNAA